MLSTGTGTVLNGSTKTWHGDFNALPRTDAGEVFSVTLRLRRKRAMPAWTGKQMTHKEHESRHGANRQDVARIAAFADRAGLKVERVLPGSREVVLSGTAEVMGRSFSTDLRQAEIDGRRCRVRQGAISVPPDIAKIVTSVTGLDNRPFARPHYRIGRQMAHVAGVGSAGTAQAPNTAFTPAEIASLYSFPAGFDGAGQTIAVVELDGGFRDAELAAYFAELGIAKPSVTVVPFAGGGANTPGTDALDPFCRDAEVVLDLAVAGGVAPGANLLVYFAEDDSDQSFLAAVSAIVHDSVHKPGIISISWGGPEPAATLQFRNDFDSLLESAAHLGITVCVATGDNAAPDFPAGDPRWDSGAHVDFPASSPWALACGGTRISVANNAIAQEGIWFDGPHDGAGGGISRAFPVPDYQRTAAVPRALNPDGPAMRGIPDVSANAAPASGFRILCNGQRFPDPAKNVPAMGGTSAVAPLWAALVARINQALGRPCGFLNPALYRIAAAGGPSVFRNPLDGTNGSYVVGPGWNPCSGLGSVDGAKLLTALSREAAPAAGATGR